MAIVTEISWDDMLDGKPLPETPARKAWRDAVQRNCREGQGDSARVQRPRRQER